MIFYVESRYSAAFGELMWEALWGEDHTPLDLLVTDKEEACARLAQLPGARKQDTR